MSLFLRTTDAYGRAYGKFQWPLEVGAVVTAPDWNPNPVCGGGLHGLLNGLGESSHLSFAGDAIWWIVEADDAVDIGGKHKFRACRVVAFGPRHEITAALYAMVPGPIHGLTLTGGYGATLTGGYGAALTGGDRATLTGGDYATLTGGDGATLIFLRWINGARRVLTAYVGEDGVKSGVAYRANDKHTAIVEAAE